MTDIHYFMFAVAAVIVAFSSGYAFGYVKAMKQRMDKADEASLEDDDMQDTQPLEP